MLFANGDRRGAEATKEMFRLTSQASSDQIGQAAGKEDSFRVILASVAAPLAIVKTNAVWANIGVITAKSLGVWAYQKCQGGVVPG